MNAVTDAFRRWGRRSAELDPFAPEPDVEPRVSYGCVDWYAYGEEQSTAPALAPKVQPQTPAVRLPLGEMPGAQPRAQLH
jgi:hypothetical protein